MHPNRFGYPVFALNKISMPVGNRQVVGCKRLAFDCNTLNRLGLAVFRKQHIAFFQTACLNPFAVAVKRVDSVGNDGLRIDAV